MAIVANRSTEVGDVIFISAEVPIVGLLALTDFTDTVVGDTVTRYFEKTFRYSLDGINWSYWEPLTVPNITAIVVNPTSVFMVEYRYQRVGDPLGELQFDDATIEGTFAEGSCGPTYNDSVFATFFHCMDLEVMQWCLNVLEKLYRSGIIPQYITRGGNSNFNLEDQDYVDFWRTIACYFALFVKYARTFETFQSNDFLLREFLTNRGMFLCAETEYIDLLHLMNHFWDEIRQRGLQLMLVKKGETLSDGRLKAVDGEFLRLICHKVCDEFIFSLTEPENTSWNIHNCSPLFTGLHNHANVMKGYATNPGPLSALPVKSIDLSEYPLVEPSFIKVQPDTDNQGNAIEAIAIKNTSGVKSGIGLVHGGGDFTSDQKAKAIVFDPCLDYEVTFLIKRIAGTVPTIDFAFYTYTEDWLGPLTMQRADKTLNPSSYTNNFFYQELCSDIAPIISPKPIWYLVRGIVFGLYRPWKASFDQQRMPNVNLGYNLHNSKANINYYPGACHCIPSVLINTGGGVSGEVRITDFAMRPLRTEFSTSFINLNKWINIWAHNNNGQYTQAEIESIIRYYLIPYSSNFKFTVTNDCMTGDKETDATKFINLSTEHSLSEFKGP